MNAPQAHAVEANAHAATPTDTSGPGKHHAHAWTRNNGDDTTRLEDEQLDAEMEFMIAEMSGKNRRELRRSLAR